MAFDITPYIDMAPSEIRHMIRQGKIDFPTAGMCRGYAQANLVILPPEYAKKTYEITEKLPKKPSHACISADTKGLLSYLNLIFGYTFSINGSGNHSSISSATPLSAGSPSCLLE